MIARVQSHPADFASTLALARNYWILGELDESERWYTRTLEATVSAAAEREVAAVLSQRGRYVEAAPHLERLAEVDPKAENDAWAGELLSAIRAASSKSAAATPRLLQREADGTWSNSVGMRFVEIKGGTFEMGRTGGPVNETPVHPVSLSTFFIGKHEVTLKEFRHFLDDSDYRMEFPPPNFFTRASSDPVVQVSWNDARAFTIWLSTREAVTYRLPSEAEWEYGARGTDGRTEPWGNELGAEQVHGNWGRGIQAAMKGRSPSVAPVGSYPAGNSPFGLTDMSGNASEWCLDLFDAGYYRRSPSRDPFGPILIEPAKEARRVLRGSSWKDPSSRGHATVRKNAIATQAYSAFGFRVVRENRAATRPQ